MTKLSIIVPFYKGESYVAALIRSIRRSSDVSVLTYELILLVDSPGSDAVQLEKDVSAILVGDRNLKKLSVVRNEINIGVAASRNRGLDMASGDYVYCVDQDDEVAEDFFNVIQDPIERRYEFVLLNGDVHYEGRKKVHRIFYLRPPLKIRNFILDDIVRSPGQVILSRQMVGELRFPVPKKAFGSDDKFFWILLFLKRPEMKKVYVDKPVYRAWIHGNNFSHDRIGLQLSSLEMWDFIRASADTTKVSRYIMKNILYLKFIVRSRLQLTFAERILGFWEVLWYFTRPNKVIRYIIKHI